jgi:hypothetical protein
MTFLLSEDQALRIKLQGMTVSDQKSVNENLERPVGVWFGQPDQELRTQNYPYVTIDMLDVRRDPQREHRGLVSPSYLTPEGLDPATSDFVIHMPIPVMIDYQITTYSRHPRHDRAIISQLLFEKLPLRFGVLELDDGTVRRMDVTDVSKRDITEQAKRLFVNAVTVQVSSEIPESLFTELTKVTSIHVHNPSTARAGGRGSYHQFEGLGEFTNP